MSPFVEGILKIAILEAAAALIIIARLATPGDTPGRARRPVVLWSPLRRDPGAPPGAWYARQARFAP
jgi:hypothetical protein